MGNSEHTNLPPVRAAQVRTAAAAICIVLAATEARAQHAVTVAWDRNLDAFTAGYRLFVGTASGSYQWSVDVGNQVSARLNGPAGRYYFVVRAYNSSNQYGPASNEASASFGVTTPTPTAAIQAVLQAPNTALVSWQTTNAAAASINGTPVPVLGSATVPIGQTTTFTLTAASASGLTATARATVAVDSHDDIPPPEPVTNLRASVSGSRVTLSWEPNPLGSAPSNYIVYAGSYPWGDDVVSGLPLGNVLGGSADMPPGSYYVRVRAANTAAVARSGEQAFVRVGTQLAPPADLNAEWRGPEVTLRWRPSAAESGAAEPAGYILEAGSAPGLADVARIPVGLATTFSATVTSGAYFVRVRAVNERGDSNPSREIVVAAPGTAAAPEALAAAANGAAVRIGWRAPVGGPPVLGYVVDVGSDPYHSDLASIQIGNVTEFTVAVPRGIYFVRVRAVTGSGAGLPSNEVVIRR